MSSGPGSRERQILAALEERPAVWLIDLLPPPHTRAQYNALQRAAKSLARKGRIVYDRGCAWRLGYDPRVDGFPRTLSYSVLVDDETRKWRWRYERRRWANEEERSRWMEERG